MSRCCVCAVADIREGAGCGERRERPTWVTTSPIRIFSHRRSLAVAWPMHDALDLRTPHRASEKGNGAGTRRAYLNGRLRVFCLHEVTNVVPRRCLRSRKRQPRLAFWIRMRLGCRMGNDSRANSSPTRRCRWWAKRISQSWESIRLGGLEAVWTGVVRASTLPCADGVQNKCAAHMPRCCVGCSKRENTSERHLRIGFSSFHP